MSNAEKNEPAADDLEHRCVPVTISIPLRQLRLVDLECRGRKRERSKVFQKALTLLLDVPRDASAPQPAAPNRIP